jgi:hypothetical protein
MPKRTGKSKSGRGVRRRCKSCGQFIAAVALGFCAVCMPTTVHAVTRQHVAYRNPVPSAVVVIRDEPPHIPERDAALDTPAVVLQWIGGSGCRGEP